MGSIFSAVSGSICFSEIFRDQFSNIPQYRDRCPPRFRSELGFPRVSRISWPWRASPDTGNFAADRVSSAPGASGTLRDMVMSHMTVCATKQTTATASPNLPIVSAASPSFTCPAARAADRVGGGGGGGGGGGVSGGEEVRTRPQWRKSWRRRISARAAVTRSRRRQIQPDPGRLVARMRRGVGPDAAVSAGRTQHST